MRSPLAAALAGLAATVPMTLAMEAMFRRLPWLQQYPLPPRLITMRTLQAVGLSPPPRDDERLAITLLGHFGYGTAAGTVYGLLARRLLPGALGGAAYGLGVWAGSYLGWLPAAGIHPPATFTPAQRNALMIAAHLIWGAALGAATQGLDDEPD